MLIVFLKPEEFFAAGSDTALGLKEKESQMPCWTKVKANKDIGRRTPSKKLIFHCEQFS
jgi:hypothetical protein